MPSPATLQVKDAGSNTLFMKTMGSGLVSGDPLYMFHVISDNTGNFVSLTQGRNADAVVAPGGTQYQLDVSAAQILLNPSGTFDRARTVGAQGDGLGVELGMQPSSTPSGVTAAINAPAVITYPATVSQSHRLTTLLGSYSVAPTAGSGNITVLDGTNQIINQDITAVGPWQIFLPDGGIKGTPGNSMTITLAPGGSAGCVAKLAAAKLTA